MRPPKATQPPGVPELRCLATALQVGWIPPRGVEQSAETTEKPHVAPTGGAESGALGGEIGPELAEVVRAWPSLPGDARVVIITAVRKAGEGGAKQ